MIRNFEVRWAVIAAATAALVGCGGSSDPEGGAPSSSQAPPTTAPVSVTKVDGWEQPASADQGVASIKSRKLGAAPVATPIVLGALAQEKTAVLGGSPGRRQVGVAREVSATGTASETLQRLQWKTATNGNGSQVAALSFSAEGAHGLRLGVVVKQLSGSAQLRVYSQADPGTVFQVSGQELLQQIQSNIAAGGLSRDTQTWWTPDMGSDEVTLEIELPAGTPVGALDISVPRVSHLYEDLSLPTDQEFSTKINESASCQLDASCYETYVNQRNAVARMIFTSGGGTYVCTGTLLNDSRSTGTPYFLTANHCIATQAEASSIQTDWFYRAPTCNSRTLSSNTARRLGGATLLYTTPGTDMTLLRLNNAPPPGAFFAGWDANTQATGSSVVGLHHPRGDLLKASFGTLTGLSSCAATSATGLQCSGSSGNFYRVNWSQGTTEGGSSGSALFKGGTHVIGTLYGGRASCSTTTTPDFFGRFDLTYDTELRTWLAPEDTSKARTAVYRFFNGRTGAHFYTASAPERDFVIRAYPEFAYESIAFYAYSDASSGRDPVFRFFNSTSGAHFYTGSAAERDFVIATYPQFLYEAVSWFAQTAQGDGASPMYRFYNARTGAHFYTISAAERDFVIQVYRDFRYEGPAYSAWTTP